jgi:hypothetical protein
LIFPAACPPHILLCHLHISYATTIRTSSEIAGHFLTFVSLLQNTKFENVEDNFQGRRLPGKMTFREYNFQGRQPLS